MAEEEFKDKRRGSIRTEIRSLTQRSRRKERARTKKRVKAKFQWVKYVKIILSIGAVILAGILYQLKFGSCEFWANYERNYNKIVYGDENFCIRQIDSSLIHEKLLEQVAGQNDSVELIRASLNLANTHEYIQIIFHGMTGSGKTLSSQIIESNFPNIQKYIWNIHSTIGLAEKVGSRVSKCGFNLVIIDDLEVNNECINFISLFERRIREEVAKRHKFRVVLLAIFKDVLTEEMKEDLKDFAIIDFQPITQDSFIKCIEIHQRLYDIHISAKELEELKETDYSSSGCKLISKKLIEIKDQI